MRAFVQQGYTVVPINPHETESRRAEGLRVGARRARTDRHGVVLRAARIGEQVIDEVARKQIPEVWLNPGAESDALDRPRPQRCHIQPIVACSIVAIGQNPYAL